MPTDFEAMINNISNETRTEEAYAELHELLKGAPKNDPHTAIATAAVYLATHAIVKAHDELVDLNKQLDGHWPTGDMVMLAAFNTAAVAITHIMAENAQKRNDVRFIVKLLKAKLISEEVLPGVINGIKNVMDRKPIGSIKIDENGEIDATVMRKDTDK